MSTTDNRYQEFIDLMPTACCFLNEHRAVIYMNRSMARIFQQSGKDPIGRHIEELVPAQHIQLYRHAIDQAFTGSDSTAPFIRPIPGWPIVTASAARNGTILFINEWTGYPIAYNKDINTRSLAEELRASQAMLELFLRASSDFVYKMDATWTYLYELSENDFISGPSGAGKSWLERYIPASDQPRVQKAIGEAIAGKHVFDLEHQVFTTTGGIGWTHSRALPVLNAAGDIIEWLGTARDITARRQAEEELSRNYTLLSQSEQLAGAGTWDYDLASGKLTWSEGMYRLFGLSKGTSVQPSVYWSHATTQSRPAAKRVITKMLGGTAEFTDTLEIVVGGVTRALQLKATIVRNERGEPVRVLGVDMDITAALEAERRIQLLQAQQQQEIFRATLNAQEQERRRMSESLHHGLAQLLYGAKLAVNILSVKLAAQDQKKFEQSKRYAGKLLAEAISECRQLSHELMPTVLAEFGLAAAIRDVCDQMRGNTQFNCTIDIGQAKLDNYLELAIFRTVQELVLNVAKHAAASQAEVNLSVHDSIIRLEVSDNGKGISPSSERPGIGLASIRSKCELLKGSLVVTPQQPNGTSVVVTLPFTNVDQ